MCGRFSSALQPSDAWLELMQEWSDELFDRYNVSPASQIGVFVEGQCHVMRWYLPGQKKSQINKPPLMPVLKASKKNLLFAMPGVKTRNA